MVLDGPDRGQMFLHGRTNDLTVTDGLVTSNPALIAGNSIVGVYK